MELAKLWTLAGRALMPALQNQVLTLLFYSAIHCAKMDTFKELLHHAYEVREDTKLKKVAIEEIARCISMETFNDWTRDRPEGGCRI